MRLATVVQLPLFVIPQHKLQGRALGSLCSARPESEYLMSLFCWVDPLKVKNTLELHNKAKTLSWCNEIYTVVTSTACESNQRC